MTVCGAAQADHVGDGAQGAHREGVHHVEHRHVDDRAPRAELADLLDEVVRSCSRSSSLSADWMEAIR